MQKPFKTMTALVILIATTLPSLSGKQMQEQRDVPIRRFETSEFNKERPHAPARPLFSARIDTDLSLLFVSAMYDVDDVFVRIENLSNGECDQYTFNSTEPAFFPLNYSTGLCRVTLILNSGAKYVGEFQL